MPRAASERIGGAVSECRQQGLISAPIDRVWDLLGNPARHPDWWPRVVEVRGESFDTGDAYVQVTRNPLGERATAMQIDEIDEMRSLRFHCTTTGTYTSWLLTPAQNDTFVEAVFGMQPASLQYKVFDAAVGRAYFRRWLEQSFRALSEAAGAQH
jgi:Polyketide cyclase / dehydrase and lipid transport